MGISCVPLSPLLGAPMEHLQPQHVPSALALLAHAGGILGISERHGGRAPEAEPG